MRRCAIMTSIRRTDPAEWPFADPPNVAVFTSIRVLEDGAPIQFVAHDEEDGAWEFHPGPGPTPSAEAAVVALREIVDLDPSVAELHDLPVGWQAWLDSPPSRWRRRPAPLRE